MRMTNSSVALHKDSSRDFYLLCYHSAHACPVAICDIYFDYATSSDHAQVLELGADGYIALRVSYLIAAMEA